MRKVGGVVYYTSGDVGAVINRSRQTVVIWDELSDEMVKGSRLIPKPIRVNGQRLWTKDEVRQIKKFTEALKRGDLALIKKSLKLGETDQERQEQKQRWAVEGKGGIM